MLQPVCGHPYLRAAHTDKRAFGNVVVNAVDIRVGMVNNIVFLFPDETISAKGVQRKAECSIDPFAGGIAAMVGIVHDVESDTGKY